MSFPRPSLRSLGGWSLERAARAGPLGLLMASVLCVLLPAETFGAPASWWDAAYSFRRQITVNTGSNSPDKGYAGYTVRIPAFDTETLVAGGKLQADCDDLRVARFDGASWSEVDRHVRDCDSAATDIRFMLQADIAASSSDTSYFLYYGNPSAGAPAPLATTNVYLWYDDASTDRSGSYVHGRVDPWHGSGWDDSLVWNPSGYYTYDNGDNFTSGYRRAVDERDVYVEAEFFHTGCYPNNMTSGLLVRGIVASGSGGSEQSDHYYASNRGEQAACGSGYAHDGDIMETDRGTAAVDGPNPGAIATDQWRKQALAAWLTNSTNLKFWDSDTGWAAPGWPAAGDVLTSGSDGNDYEGRGFVALMTAQDQARVRNLLVRRYVEPEPSLGVGAEETEGSAGNTACGTATVTGDGTLTVPIASVDPAKAFLLFQTRHDSNRPVGSLIRGRIASATSLEFVQVTDQSAAITFDAASSTNATNVSSISWTHSIGSGKKRKLLVGVAVEEDSPGDEVVQSVTYGGVPLSFAEGVTIDTTFLQRVEIWYLDEADIPGSGPATVEVTLSGSVAEVNAGALSLEGAQPGAPEATATNTAVDAKNITTDITTQTDGAWIIDLVGSGNGGSFSPGSGQTERWDTSAASATGAMSTKPVPTAGSESMRQQHSTKSNRTAHALVAIPPAPLTIPVTWCVVEYPTGVNVQRGEVTQDSSVVDVPITPVAGVDQAFVTWSKTPAASDVVWSADDPIVGELTSPSNLQLRAGSGNSSHVIWWQVVEFTNAADINVQTGSTALTGSTLSVDVTLPAAVDVGTTFVLAGFRTSGSGSDVGERMIRAQLVNSTTIRIDRSAGGDDITEIEWQAVELKDGSTVQRGSENFGTGVAQKTVPINAVDITRAAAFGSVQSGGGQNMGRSPYRGDDVIGVGSATAALSSSQLTLERANTADQADIGWFVVEFNNIAPPSADHFDIDHDGAGIHCVAEPITVTAEDAIGDPVTDYGGTITLDTQTGRGTWSLASGDGTFSDATADDGMATYTFAASDNGTASFDLDYREGPSPIDILVSDGTATDDDTEGPLPFSPSGFTVTPNPLGNPPGAIDPIPAQAAGAAFTLYLTAYGQTPTDPTCGVIESYDGPKTLKFWSTYSNPSTGSVPVTIDGSAIATAEASASGQGVTFTQGEASVAAKYKDVGEIRISMKDDTISNPDLPGGIRGATNLFVVKPADFELSNIVRTSDGFANPGASNANGPVFVAAGDAFSVTVTARDAEGDATPNYGQESPAEGVDLTPTLVKAGDTNNPDIQFTTGFGAFSGGSATGTDFSWGEVGIITLTPSVGDGDYLGAGDVTGTETGNVGRFIPFDFDAATNTPQFGTACGTFTYVGQPFEYTTQPIITVTARNKQGGTTQNYTAAWWKITDAKLAADGNKTYAAASGTLDTSLVPTPDPTIADNGGGTGTLTFDDGGGLAFVRSAAPVAPFDAEIGLSLDVIDEDDVTHPGNPVEFGDASAGNGIAFSSGKTMRWGRIAMQNAHGSELLPLDLPMLAQYYDGAGFVTNTDDNCSGVAVGELILSNDVETNQTDGDIVIGGSSTTATIANNPFAAGDAGLSFSAPGEGNTGYVDVVADLSTASGADLPWLRFDWDGDGSDDDPGARATFGIYRGSDYIIHVREPWN